MTASALILLPFAAACVLTALADPRRAAWVNALAATAAFLLAALLPFITAAPGGGWLFTDRLAVLGAMLTAAIGCAASWFSLHYTAAELAAGRLDAARLRIYHPCFQTMLGALLLAILADNLALAWVAIETATIAGVLVIGLSRTEDAIEASWKTFIVCGVGVALALFGTVAVGFAADGVTQPGNPLCWSGLLPAAAHLRGATLNLAFAFLLVGYGTKAALAPLHSWMPDAHNEGPTPVSAVLSSSIQNAALLILLRVRMVMDANNAAGGGAIAPGPALVALGVASVLVGAFAAWRRRAVKRFFAFSSIEQNGVAVTAMGLGLIAPALLHITLHSLIKAALFQCAGLAAQRKGGKTFAQLGGLLHTDRALALTLGLGVIALCGLPPFGLFTSEFLIVTGAMGDATGAATPWAALAVLPLAVGLLAGAWALIARLQAALLGPATPYVGPRISIPLLLPAWAVLGAAIVLGLAWPVGFGAWLQGIAP